MSVTKRRILSARLRILHIGLALNVNSALYDLIKGLLSRFHVVQFAVLNKGIS